MNPDMKTAAAAARHERWTFFKQWLRRPLSTAAVSPSSRHLAKRIVRALPPGTRRVIELGAGTGVFTKAMLDHGITSRNLLAVEFNPQLHAFLTHRFPGLTVIEGDARQLESNAVVTAFVAEGPVQAFVSGLGLLSMTKESQRAILQGAFALMPANGVFVQFTYGPVAPVAREVLDALDLKAERTGFTLLNLPPASVFVFSKKK